MRCGTCDKLLNEWESARKDPRTGEYYDLCGVCYTAYRSALTELEDSSGIVYKDTTGPIET